MHTDAVAVQLEKGMSDVLRGASERDDGQMPPADAEPHFRLTEAHKAVIGSTTGSWSPKSSPKQTRSS